MGKSFMFLRILMLKRVWIPALFIAILPGLYLQAVNTGKINGVYGNYIYGYELDPEEKVSKIEYCQLTDEYFYSHLSVSFNGQNYTPFISDFKEYHNDFYKILHNTSIKIVSDKGDYFTAYNVKTGSAISFKSKEKLNPGKYTIYINLPDLESFKLIKDYQLSFNKLSTSYIIGHKKQIRMKPQCK